MIKIFKSIIVAMLLGMPGMALAENIIDLDVGYRHACALYDNGTVWCWGSKLNTGQEPLPLTADAMQPYKVSGLPPSFGITVGYGGACAVDKVGKVRCWGIDIQRSYRAQQKVISRRPFIVENLPPVATVDMGFGHLCALTITGEIWCWGTNSGGLLGVGDTLDRSEPEKIKNIEGAVSISAGFFGSCAVMKDYNVACWGADSPGKSYFVYNSTTPVRIKSVENLKKVVKGRNFACGLHLSGKVTCWGSNIFRMLGTDKKHYLKNPSVGIGKESPVHKASDISASAFHTCAIEKGKIVCWGLKNDEKSKDKIWHVKGISAATKIAIGPSFSCALVKTDVTCWETGEATGYHPGGGLKSYKAFSISGLPRN